MSAPTPPLRIHTSSLLMEVRSSAAEDRAGLEILSKTRHPALGSPTLMVSAS